MSRQTGFTLIELVIVIVILGILAAYAVPKYMELDKEARISVVEGLEGSLRASSDMVHALALAKETTGASTTLDIGPSTIDVSNGFAQPTSAGIGTTIVDLSGFDIVTTVADTISFQKKGAPTPGDCQATYVYDDSTPGNYPAISRTTSGC
ncbi:pilin [Candidatus Reidiella endopervernicosa]|nr:prepilin-type N-terminal cleavage/methylation domain-containing protein [Candidatus Reidiella endopervernicosa]QKQ27218.1 prepilin-type N-terminal cleavage/methylation domain-containing protein [Candidatus Reidiella endopervernicosa]